MMPRIFIHKAQDEEGRAIISQTKREINPELGLQVSPA